MNDLINELSITWNYAPWVYVLGAATMIGGIVFYFRDLRKRQRNFKG